MMTKALLLSLFAMSAGAEIASTYSDSNFSRVSKYLRDHTVGVVCNYDVEKTYVGQYKSEAYCNGVALNLCFASIKCVMQKTGKVVDAQNVVCPTTSGTCPARVEDCALKSPFKAVKTGTDALDQNTNAPDVQQRIQTSK